MTRALIVAIGVAAVATLVACPPQNLPKSVPPADRSQGYDPPAPGHHRPVDTRPPAAPPTSAGPLPTGAACLGNAECESGICEGKGCGADAPGVCVGGSRRCTRDRRMYCGCDGVVFYGSGSCPGRRYASTGACPAK